MPSGEFSGLQFYRFPAHLDAECSDWSSSDQEGIFIDFELPPLFLLLSALFLRAYMKECAFAPARERPGVRRTHQLFVLYCIVFIYTLAMALNASKRGFIAKEYVTW